MYAHRDTHLTAGLMNSLGGRIVIVSWVYLAAPIKAEKHTRNSYLEMIRSLKLYW